MTKHTHHEIGDHAACIRLVPIFNHLEDSAMNYIAEKAHTKQYQKGEFLFRSQEKEDTLYIINIQDFSNVDTIVFDKTGTLTVGNPTVAATELYEKDSAETLGYLASVERGIRSSISKSGLKPNWRNKFLSC